MEGDWSGSGTKTLALIRFQRNEKDIIIFVTFNEGANSIFFLFFIILFHHFMAKLKKCGNLILFLNGCYNNFFVFLHKKLNYY